MAKLSPVFNDQTFDASGDPAVGYKLFTYAAGSSTKQTTYTDSAGTVPQTNPIILNASGYPTNGPIWLTSGLTYKFVLASSTDTDPPSSPLKTIDNVAGINDTTAAASQWISPGVTPTYVSATSFTLVGDQTVDFHVGRRVQFTVNAGTVYGTILTSTFGAVTTVVMSMASGQVLDAGLSALNVSLLRADVSALPARLTEIHSLNAGPLAGFRNRLINGGMAIDNRNAGAAQTFTAGAALAYCVDRWYGYCTGANVTGQRVAGTLTSQYRYQFTGAASVTTIGFGQRIEAANAYDMNNATATFGVDLANSLLTTVTWTAYYANTADSFGTLASPTRVQIATGTFTVSSTLTRYYAQIAIPAAETTGIELVLTVGAQTSGTWTIGNAQFVPGSSNEIYKEFRPASIEQQLCERYLPVMEGSYCMGQAISATSADIVVPFRTLPRTAPTGITLSAAATNWAVAQAGGSASFLTGLAFAAAPSAYSALLSATGASGLVAGNATFLSSAANKVLFTGCEL